MSKKTDYVDRVYDDFVEVVCYDERRQSKLTAMGGEKRLKRGHKWIFRYGSEAELAGLLARMRDIGLGFIGGDKTRHPCAVCECLREKGLFQGKFTELVRHTEGKFKSVER
jgi:hypothetical protein